MPISTPRSRTCAAVGPIAGCARRSIVPPPRATRPRPASKAPDALRGCERALRHPRGSAAVAQRRGDRVDRQVYPVAHALVALACAVALEQLHLQQIQWLDI